MLLAELFGFRWICVKDGDSRVSSLYKRHYSCHRYKDNRRLDTSYRQRHLVAGPGEKLILLTPSADAVMVWRKFQNKVDEGVNCAVFRNESSSLSSDLIIASHELVAARWPSIGRYYTYVNQNKIRSTNPGYCFLMAGWQRMTERTKKRGLIRLEYFPKLETLENQDYEND